MPSTSRPGTDYERWLVYHNPNVHLSSEPDYGPHRGRDREDFLQGNTVDTKWTDTEQRCNSLQTGTIDRRLESTGDSNVAHENQPEFSREYSHADNMLGNGGVYSGGGINCVPPKAGSGTST
ncbi:hypothetical protein FE257_007348 [Aspergillus nanangensis]|uniref:Uncharacterized protein n=1 Tax=Aspergillus nanangensis TaxID=2582783 RepID=A0AAD4CMY7_ASPNN|nr:hypothetical protein FE257_007348 [Aspergillus nanangensis]